MGIPDRLNSSCLRRWHSGESRGPVQPDQGVARDVMEEDMIVLHKRNARGITENARAQLQNPIHVNEEDFEELIVGGDEPADEPLSRAS